jgi:hypothetical protein
MRTVSAPTYFPTYQGYIGSSNPSLRLTYMWSPCPTGPLSTLMRPQTDHSMTMTRRPPQYASLSVLSTCSGTSRTLYCCPLERVTFVAMWRVRT